ncbi:PfkB family carbohydrate kinase [Nocardia sp. NPDC049149]|uniref:PfkB family carbohydrate kinase n=1 Tax=Nocardia sp. NPDC049149 TaxID=3364315 RepID=UPI00370F9BA7
MGYQLIEPQPCVIEAGHALKVPILLNLGGSELSGAMATVVRRCSNLVIQTNVDDAEHAEAPAVARSLLARTGAHWVVVTAGAAGAVAVSSFDEVAMSAFPVDVWHTHSAGAAFSGGLRSANQS